MHSKHLGMNLGRNSKGRTRTNSGEVFSSNSGWLTNSASSLACLCTSSSTSRSSSSSSNHRRSTRWQQASVVVVEENEEKKEGKKEEKERARVGDKMGKLHFPSSQSTNLKQAPNSPSTKPLLPLGHPKHTEEPETKPPETHKHQHTTNNRE